MTPERVRRLREGAGWRPERLAVAAGLAAATVRKYEQGNKRLSGESLARIAAALEAV